MQEISKIINKKYSKKSGFEIEKKNQFGSVPYFYDNFFNFMASDNGLLQNQLSRYTPYLFYGSCSYLATAVDKIANEVSTIKPIIINNETKETINTSDLLSKLKFPNGDELWSTFARSFASHYSISGNCFLRLSGNINEPPKEIFIVDPRFVTSTMGSDGTIGEYIETLPNQKSFTYQKKYTKNGSRFIVRYITNDKEFELVHIKDLKIFPSPIFASSSYGWGRSKVSAIFYEIEQIEKANIFNKAVLERGAKPGLVIKSKPKIQDEEEYFKSNILNNATGPENAGNTMYIDDTIDIKDFSKTPRDMDYQSLINEVKKVIYQRYDIPLPLVSDKIMTYNNLETAIYMLYDSAVLPVVNSLFEAITVHIFPRYSEYDENFSISYNPREIEALESRQLERIKVMAETNTLTRNEIRSELGYDDIEERQDISDEMKQFIYHKKRSK